MSGIRLKFGNLSVEEFEKRTGWELANEERIFMKSHLCDQASSDNIRRSKGFHIFDKPFSIECAKEIAPRIIDICTSHNAKHIPKQGLDIEILADSEDKDDR